MDSTIEQKGKTERPPAIRRAVQVLVFALAIGLITSIFQLTKTASGAQLILASLVVISVFSLGFLLIWKIATRRNWARIVLLALVLFGLPFAIPTHVQEVKRNLLSGTIGIIITLLQLIGTALLFTKPANLWFRERK